jgi:type II secretory pathway component GspD/PulD (secretin)
VLVYGAPADVAKAGDALSRLDKARAQVSIKVAVTEINSTASRELGVEWAYGDISVSENGDQSGIKFGSFNRQPLSFTGTISALIKNGNGRLLAEPNISVVDGETASILIGERILFPKLVGYNTIGTPIYDAEEERVGIYLQIAPRVSGSDEIILTLYPQVSLVTSYLKTQAGDYPQISTREARTTVMVKNGATLSIGGLLRDDDIKSLSKVPLLGDLPIIGQFFRRNKTTRERTEIVILLTPTLLVQD